jgi:hypothetical protein
MLPSFYKNYLCILILISNRIIGVLALLMRRVIPSASSYKPSAKSNKSAKAGLFVVQNI